MLRIHHLDPSNSYPRMDERRAEAMGAVHLAVSLRAGSARP
jgi:hypothetical protein